MALLAARAPAAGGEPAIPPLLPGTVEREAVRYRVAIYDALRQRPDEYRRRLNAWRALRRRWTEQGLDPARTETVHAWLREATRRTRAGRIEPLPELPRFARIKPVAPPPTEAPRAAASPPPQAWPTAASPPRLTPPAARRVRTARQPASLEGKAWLLDRPIGRAYAPHSPSPGMPSPAPAEKIEGFEPPRAATAARLQPHSAMPKTPTGARPAETANKVAPPSPRLEPSPNLGVRSRRAPEPVATASVAPPNTPEKTPPLPPLQVDAPKLLKSPSLAQRPPVEALPDQRRVVARKPAAPAEELADLLFGNPPPREPPPQVPSEVARVNEVELMARIRGYNDDLRRLTFKLAEPDRAWTARELAEALAEIHQLEEARGIVDLYLPLVEKARRPHMGRPQPLENVKRLLRARVESRRAELISTGEADPRWRLDVLDALLRQMTE